MIRPNPFQPPREPHRDSNLRPLPAGTNAGRLVLAIPLVFCVAIALGHVVVLALMMTGHL
ncbi:hypothetical protein FYK55_19140 [Roseiconus nitratireducens]|uniref:Uncharacterized protein n=1 Tax=Roseiconus nitratireducens TaxID=2605748 RepID=A0A5M6D1Y5_9BACT|nr:hypothetical protein [Roseiconus nitratireducens]KAA5541016.1 hypothetical protein FYK55_19140 [Roseiconus nitratireducens]